MKSGHDILSDYGRDVDKPQAPRAKSGGVTSAKTLDYAKPKGPTSQSDEGPGLHGTNHGCGPQGHH